MNQSMFDFFSYLLTLLLEVQDWLPEVCHQDKFYFYGFMLPTQKDVVAAYESMDIPSEWQINGQVKITDF